MKHPINEVVVVDAWNIRASTLSEGRVQDYAEHLEDLPPVRVARLNGVLYLVDGWHRMAAHRLLNRAEIDVAIDESLKTEVDARIAAFRANITHGLFLSSEQKRQWFNSIFSLQPKWSLRDWAKELGVSHVTVSNWASVKNLTRLPKHASADRRAAIVTIESICVDWCKYERKELSRFPIERWSPDYRRKIKDMLKPLAEFYNAL